MTVSAQSIGRTVREVRHSLGVTQRQLAMTAGTGLRFVIELEQGKPTCQLERVLAVLHALGVDVVLNPPPVGEGA
ncbi:MAG: helix-turn-helix transcriptional regulator [Gammaproteobacteria bacterium]|nr:type II toxin-antitoxin system Y4mF family antitoxin [Gammaproteobacteria bacterium]MXY52972.1 helix-turn-helix transcriptional regulator [Gammaproteobacteria bacterium]MYB38268.1 helix-turn-helix transcriptional regulator [Gammaproteobacteria bacterium]